MSKDYILADHALPNDELLKAIGEMSVRHGQLDLEIRRIVKSLAGITIVEVLDATASEMSAQVRKRALRLSRRRFGDGNTFLRIQAWMQRAKRLSESRNELLHCHWAKETGTEGPARALTGTKWKDPTVEQIRASAEEMLKLALEIATARRGGWLAEVLSATKPV